MRTIPSPSRAAFTAAWSAFTMSRGFTRTALANRPPDDGGKLHISLGLDGAVAMQSCPAMSAGFEIGGLARQIIWGSTKHAPNLTDAHGRTAMVDGVSIFYREAGPADAPVVLLLHGFPISSHMFRNLIPIPADRYHVIGPDYPGFGESDAQDHTKFAYTFAHYADVVDGFRSSA